MINKRRKVKRRKEGKEWIMDKGLKERSEEDRKKRTKNNGEKKENRMGGKKDVNNEGINKRRN